MSKHLSARDAACLVLRLGLGIIFIVHGFDKISHHDWGTTWERELGTPTQVLVAWTELIGGLMVLVGFLGRIGAAGLACVMAGALYLVGTTKGFVGDESATAAPAFSYLAVGAEYNFALLAQCVAVMILGSGALSVDRFLPRGRRAARLAAAGHPAVAPPHMEVTPAPAPAPVETTPR